MEPSYALSVHNLRNRAFVVVGAGVSGNAMARWLHRHQAQVTVIDSRAQPPYQSSLMASSIEIIPSAWSDPPHPFKLSEKARARVQSSDGIALSPGIALTSPIVQTLKSYQKNCWGECDLFYAGLREYQPQSKIIGITGSNGKTTSTTLLGLMLSAGGLAVATAGNIKPSLLDRLMSALDKREHLDVWALELSSFQLSIMAHCPFDIGVLLNISENHLDWHPNMSDYIHAKERLIRHSRAIVVNAEDAASVAIAQSWQRDHPHQPCWMFATRPLDSPPSSSLASLDEGMFCLNHQAIAPRSLSPLIGDHHAANILAMLAVLAILQVDINASLLALRDFRGLAHRTEIIAEKNEVLWINDSKSTTVASTIAALSGIGRPVIVIIGGIGKGQNFSPLAQALSLYAKYVVLFGQDAPLIAQTLKGIPYTKVATLSEAVQLGQSLAQAGDCVLLSPACASFDQFRNYEERGEAFRQFVSALTE